MKPEDNLEDLEGTAASVYAAPVYSSADQAHRRLSVLNFNGLAMLITLGAIAFIVIAGLASVMLSKNDNGGKGTGASNVDGYGVSSLSLEGVSASGQLQLASAEFLNVNGELRVKQGLVLEPGTAPLSPTAGQIYYDQTTNAPYYFNGTQFISLAPTLTPQSVTSFGGVGGNITVGNGLQMTGSQISLSDATNQALANAGGGVRTLVAGTSNVAVNNDGNGNYTLSSNAVVGSGSINQIALFTGGSTLGGSILSQTSGSSLSVAGSLTVTGAITSNTLQQTAAGQNVNISAGNDNLIFTAAGRTFMFPTSGVASQTICTTAGNCASGGGGSVLLQPGTAQIDAGTGSSIFINNTGGGNLLQLQGAGSDRFVVTNSGNTTISGTLSAATINGATITATTFNSAVISGGTLSGGSFTGGSVSGGSVTGGSLSATAVNGLNVSGTAISGTGALTFDANGVNTISIGGISTGDVLLAGGVGSTGCTIYNASGNLACSGTINTATISGGTLSGGTFTGGSVSAGTLSGGTFSGGSVSGGSLNATAVNGLNVSSTAIDTAVAGPLSIGAANATLTIGNTASTLTLQGNAGSVITATGGGFTTTVGFAGAPTASQTYNFDRTAAAGTYTVCTTAGNCVGAGGGVTASGGTNNFITKFTGATTVTSSQLYDNGTNVNIGSTLNTGGLFNVGAANEFQVAANGNVTAGTINGATITATTFNTATISGGTLSGGTFSGGTVSGGSLSATAVNGLSVSGGVITSPTIAGTLTLSSLNTAGVLHTDGSGVVSTSAVLLGTETSGNYVSALGSVTGLTLGGTNGVPGAVPTLSVNYGSAANTAVQGNTTLTCASGTGNLSGGGNSVTLGSGGSCNNLTITNSPTFSGTLSVQGAGGVTIGVAGTTAGVLNLANATNTNMASLQAAILGQATTYTLPDPGQATASICLSTGNCAGSGGGITGSGTSGTFAKFNGSGTITDSSNITESGTVVTNTGSMIIQGATGLTLGTAGPAGNTGSIDFQNSTNANKITIQSGVSASNFSLTLPTTGGNNGDCLQSQGSGVLVFTSCTGGTGGGVTSLDAQTGVLTLANSTGAAGTITIDDASTTQKGIAQFNATNFTAVAGVINTAQDIATTSSPTFAGVTINGNATVTGTINTATISGGTLSGGTFTGGTVSGGSLNATAVNGLNVSSTAIDTAVAGPLSIGAANATLTIGNTASTLTLQGNAGSVITATGGGFTTTVGFAGAPTASQTYNFDRTAAAGTYTVCTTAGNCVGAGGGVTASGGTNNFITKFTGATTVTSSQLYDNGTNVNIGSTLNTGGLFNVGAANEFQVAANGNVTAGTINGATITATTFNTATISGGTLSGGTFSGGTVSGGSLSATAVNGLSVSGGVITSPTIAGTLTLSSLNTAGVLHTDGSGVVSTSAVLLGTETSGNYVSALGSVTGLTLGGTNGVPGAVPTLSVNYGSAANTAVQGNTTLTCASGTGNLSGGGNSVTLGSGGSCNNLTITNSPTFSGTLSVQGAGGVTIGVAGTTAGVLNLANATNTNMASLQAAAPSGTGTAAYTIPSIAGGSSDTVCLLTLGNCVGAGGGVTGAGTNNYLSKYTSTGTTIGNSQLYDNGTNVNVGSTLGTGGLFNVGAANEFQVAANGAVTAVGVNSGVGLIQGTGGLATSGAVIDLNVSSNFATNINTGTSTGAVNIGNSLAGVITLQSSNSINLTAGAASTINTGASTLTVASSNFNVTAAGLINGQTISSATNFTGTVAVATLGASGSTVLCYNGSNQIAACSSTAGSGSYILNGTSLQSNANFNIQSAATTSVGGIIRGATSQTADLMQFQDSTGAILTSFDSAGKLVFGPSGAQDTNLYRSAADTLTTDDNLLVKTATNSATAFQVQNAGAADTLLTANTLTRTAVVAGNTIKIGNSTGTDADLTVLQLDGSTADPATNLASLNGGMFYNSTSNKVSIIENGIVKELCNKTDLLCGAAATTTMQNTYDDTADATPEIILTATQGALSIQDATVALGTNLLEVQSNGGGTTYLGVSATGTSIAGTLTVTGDVSVGANSSLKLTGGTVFPGAPTEGQIFYRSDTDQLYVYTGAKWQADRTTATKIVAASDSQNKEKADYVADGTDDQDDINAAINALPATGGLVYLLEGTYTVDDGIDNDDRAIKLNKSNITLTGSGGSTVIKLKTGINANLDAIADDQGAVINRITISNLRLDGNKAGNSSGIQRAIYLTGVGSGTGASATPGPSINTIWAEQFRSNAIEFSSSTNGNISNSSITANGSTTADRTIYFGSSSSRINVIGNVIQGNTGYGILINTGSSYNTFSSNTIEGNGNGGLFISSAGNINTITGNTFSGNAGTAIVLSITNKALVSGNSISTSGTHGIDLSSSTDNIVSNNRIFGSGNVTASSNGIDLGSSDSNTITGNYITDTAGTGFAIGISSSSDFNYLADNTFSGTGASSINDGATNTIYGGQINGNNDFVLQGSRTVINQDTEFLGSFNSGYGGIGQFGNLLTYSEQFDNAAWAKTSVTVPTTNNAAPDLQLTGDELNASAASGTTAQTSATAAGSIYTFSVWLKSASTTNRNISLRIDGASSGTGTAKAVMVTSGWTRFFVTQNTTGFTGNIKVSIIATAATDDVYAWGAQLLAGSSPGAYVRSTASTIATSSGVVSNGGLFVSSINPTDKPLIVQGAPSQTGNLLELQNSSGNLLASFAAEGSLTAGGSATATTGTTEATARVNVTTVTLIAAGSFANNDVIFINNAGQDYYTRIVSGAGTTSLTVSPAVSYDVSATVTKYNIQNIGATSTDYTNLNQRFFQGYFLGGIVAGAGSTHYGDGSILFQNDTNLYRSSANNLATDDSLTLAGTSSNLTVQGTGTSSFAGDLSITGSIKLLKGADYATVGITNDVDFGVGTLIRLTGISTQTITGITGGTDGRTITLVNAAAQAATLSDTSSSTSAAANQIVTGTGAAASLPAGSSVSLIYDSTSSKWRIVGGLAGSTCITCANQQLSNLSGTVALNMSLLTAGDNTIDLGSSANSFRTVYADTSVLTAAVDRQAAGTLSIGTTTQTGLTIGRVGASTTLNGDTSSSIALGNFTVSAAGAIVGVGVNSGTGLMQGTGGLTIQGISTLYASTATSSSGNGTTNWLRSPKNTVTAFVGDNDSTAAYTSSESSGNLRFNGAGVAWGDLGYYPQGGTNTQTAMGNFRLSTTGAVISTTPNARLGVGSLYVADNSATQGIQFGGDTNLYRAAANTLRTDDDFYASLLGVNTLAATNTVGLRIGTNGAGVPQFQATPQMLQWGDGTAALDTNLYRAAANILRTDDGFDAVGRLVAGYGSANQIHLTTTGQMTFGSAEDTNLYRSAANNLKTDHNFNVSSLATPGTPSVNCVDDAGPQAPYSYSYTIVAVDTAGNTTPASPAAVGSCDFSLNGSGSPQISWTKVPGAASYRVYKANARFEATYEYSVDTTFQYFDEANYAAGTAGSAPTTNTTHYNRLSSNASSWVGGSLAVGGATGSYRLDVSDYQASSYVARIKNLNNQSNADGLLIDVGSCNACRGTSNYFVGFASGGTVAGKIQGGASAVAYTTTAADYAEYFLTGNLADKPQTGDIVMLDATQNRAVVRSSAAKSLVGVVSDNPGFIGNGPLCQEGDEDCDKNYAKTNTLVGITGQIKTKVSTLNGAIQTGDNITASSIYGTGTKLAGRGEIVGKALEAFDPANGKGTAQPCPAGSPAGVVCGTVMIYVNPHYSDSDQGVQGQDANFANLLITGNSKVEGDLTVVNALTTKSLTVTGSASIGSLTVADVITTKDLTVTGSATVQGKLTVASIEVGTITIKGHIVTAGNAPIAAALAALGQNATVTIDGNDTAGTITITTGANGITAGELAKTSFSKAFGKTPRVVLSGQDGKTLKAGIFPAGKSSTGFTLSSDETLMPNTTYTLDYFIVE